MCSAHGNAAAALWDPALSQTHSIPLSTLHAANFHAWLHFLLLAAGPSDAAILVLDNKGASPKRPKSIGGNDAAAMPSISMRKQHVPSYLDKRHAKQASPGNTQAPARLKLFTAAAESLGFVVVWAQPGWEADDMIGSIAQGLVEDQATLMGLREVRSPAPAAAGQQHRADGPATVVIASSDSDMQQLLALSVAGSATVAWMELLQWPSLCVQSSGAHPTAMLTDSLPGLPWLPVRIHRPAVSQTSSVSRSQEVQKLHKLPCSDVGSSHQSLAGGQARGVECDLLTGSGSEGTDVSGSLLGDWQRPGLGLRGAMHGASDSGSQAKAPPPGEGGMSAAAAAGVEAVGMPPSMYPHYLALVGKPEAGVKGVGLSAAAAKKLLRRYGSVHGIGEAWERGLLDSDWRMLPPAPQQQQQQQQQPSHPGATQNRSSAEPAAPGAAGGGRDKLRQARLNLHATQIHCDPERAPWAELTRGAASLAGRLRRSVPLSRGVGPEAAASSLSPAYVAPSGASWTPVGAAVGALAVAAPRGVCAICHPHTRWHVLSCARHVDALSATLASAGQQHSKWYVTAQGALVDLLLVKGDDGGNNGKSGHTGVQSSPGIAQQQPAGAFFAIVVLGPADFVASKAASLIPGKARGSVDLEAALGRQLKALAGARASLEHIPKSLKVLMSGQTQVHVKHLKAQAGWRVAVIPFYELEDVQGHASVLAWLEPSSQAA